MQERILPQSGVRKSEVKVLAGLGPSEAARRTCAQTLLGLHTPSSCSRGLLPTGVRVRISPSYEDPFLCGLGPSLLQHNLSSADPICKDPVSSEVTF